VAALLAFVVTGAAAGPSRGPNLGVPASPAEIAARDTLVFPDGTGLPPGSGTAAAGAALYASRCQSCHGPEGRGGPGGELAGGNPDLRAPSPDRTIGTYWPYATTVFDFVRRAMPMTAPRSLTNDEVYALTAYLLALNGVVAKDAKLDAGTLSRITLPNRDGFDWIDVVGPPHSGHLGPAARSGH
jgi:cytochrome c